MILLQKTIRTKRLNSNSKDFDEVVNKIVGSIQREITLTKADKEKRNIQISDEEHHMIDGEA